jgi:hypothetical protein
MQILAAIFLQAYAFGESASRSSLAKNSYNPTKPMIIELHYNNVRSVTKTK